MRSLGTIDYKSSVLSSKWSREKTESQISSVAQEQMTRKSHKSHNLEEIDSSDLIPNDYSLRVKEKRNKL